MSLQYRSSAAATEIAHRTVARSLLATRSMGRVRQREQELRRANAWRAIGGLLVVGVCFGLAIGSCCLARAVMGREGPGFVANLVVATVIGPVAFLIALAIPRASRAEVSWRLSNCSQPCCGDPRGTIAGFVLELLLPFLFYGQFLLVDAAKTTRVRIRLRKAGTDRVALILGELTLKPAGVSVVSLIRQGEGGSRLGEALAYLIIYEWAELSPDGRTLLLLSASRRALRQ